MRKESEAFDKKLTADLADTLIKITDGWSRVMREANEALKRLGPLRREASARVTTFIEMTVHLEKEKERFQNELKRAFENVRYMRERLPARMRASLKLLAESGWYLEPTLPFEALFQIAKQLEDGNVEEVNDALTEYYSDRIDDFADELCQKHPKRAQILRAGFRAHKRGEFELSVPVFLAQADGICAEKIELQLFRRDRGTPVTSAHVDELVDPFRKAILHPLEIPLPISSSTKRISRSTGALNRHEIIHGESLDYGTVTNSCRAISLLRYVSVFLKSDGNASSEV